jgi:hypothetical protein
MPTPTSTDQDTGRVLDGKPRSAQWRDKEAERKAAKQRPAAEARTAAEARNRQGDAATNSRYTPPTGFTGSLMIPADQLPLDSDTPRRASSVHSRGAVDADRQSDANTDKRIGIGDVSANSAAPAQSGFDNGETDTDRFFEQRALTPPRAVARETIAAGTASLALADSPARRRRRLWRTRALQLPLPFMRARESNQRTEDRRIRSPAILLGRWRLMLATAVVVATVAGAAILTNGSPTHPHQSHHTGATVASTPKPFRAYPAGLATTVGRAITKLADHRISIRRRHGGFRARQRTKHQHARPVHRQNSPPAAQASATSQQVASAPSYSSGSAPVGTSTNAAATSIGSSRTSAAPAAGATSGGGGSSGQATQQSGGTASSASVSHSSGHVPPTGSSGALGPISSPNG